MNFLSKTEATIFLRRGHCPQAAHLNHPARMQQQAQTGRASHSVNQPPSKLSTVADLYKSALSVCTVKLAVLSYRSRCAAIARVPETQPVSVALYIVHTSRR